MSLINLNMLGMLISDLNKEILYKVTEELEIPTITKFIFLHSDGDNHKIFFLDEVIWDSEVEKNFENIPIEKDIELNERENFEKHLRNLINDRVEIVKNIVV